MMNKCSICKSALRTPQTKQVGSCGHCLREPRSALSKTTKLTEDLPPKAILGREKTTTLAELRQLMATPSDDYLTRRIARGAGAIYSKLLPLTIYGISDDHDVDVMVCPCHLKLTQDIADNEGFYVKAHGKKGTHSIGFSYSLRQGQANMASRIVKRVFGRTSDRPIEWE